MWFAYGSGHDLFNSTRAAGMKICMNFLLYPQDILWYTKIVELNINLLYCTVQYTVISPRYSLYYDINLGCSELNRMKQVVLMIENSTTPQVPHRLPSGNLTVRFGKSPFLLWRFTISMAIFNSYVANYQIFLHTGLIYI